jgi:hypothetical protein
MKITRRQLRRLILEAATGQDATSAATSLISGEDVSNGMLAYELIPDVYVSMGDININYTLGKFIGRPGFDGGDVEVDLMLKDSISKHLQPALSAGFKFKVQPSEDVLDQFGRERPEDRLILKYVLTNS